MFENKRILVTGGTDHGVMNLWLNYCPSSPKKLLYIPGTSLAKWL